MPAASHPIPSPDRNHAPKRIASTTPYYSQGVRFLYRHSRRRLGSPWVGPINAPLKRLKLATATPDATSTLSASSASLFLCRCLDAFSSSFIHAAINLQPPSRTVLYQTPGLSAAPAPPRCLIIEDPLPCSLSILSPSPPAHVFPRSLALPT